MDNGKLIFEWEVPQDYPNFTGMDDVAEAYQVYELPGASGGIVVHAKYHGEWMVNPWSARPLIRHLLNLLSNHRHSADAYCQCGGGDMYPYMPFKEMRCKKCNKPRR